MKLNKHISFLLLIGLLTSLSLDIAAKTPKSKKATAEQHTNTSATAVKALSVEQEQQFLYYFYEAQRLIQEEQLEQAWELIQFCYELNPNDPTTNYYVGCFVNVLDQQNDTAALPYFRRAYTLAPDDYWYRYTFILLQTKQKQQQKAAINIMEGVAQRKKKDSDVRELLQHAYATIGNYQNALDIQDQLDSINGYDDMSAMQRYRLNVLMHNEKQAIAEVERYLQTDPDNAQFQVFRLQLYEQTHQPANKMIEAYSAVLRLDPRNLMIMNNLAWNICISDGDLKWAEQLSRTTIMAEPTNAIYLDTYAWIMYHLKDYETALFYIQRAAEHADTQTNKEVLQHYKAIKKKLEK